MRDTLGPYRLVRPLGQGGTAELYLAEDPREPGSPPLVIKVLHPHLRVYEEAIELFLEEARLALACCGHPNIATVLGSGADGDERWIAMEFVDGVTLADLMLAHPALGAMRTAAALPILFDTCEALAHVHAHGVVHRDLNPRNLLVDRAGVTRLIDFGVAAPEPVGGGGAPNRGTWAYMSPEQITGERMDRRSDIFSLGVILWELWTGDRLFHRGPPYLTMGAVMEAPIPPLADAAMGPIVARCLEREVAARYARIEEVADALRALGVAADRAATAALL